jgi:Fe-S cluster biogenesis protein NfuA
MELLGDVGQVELISVRLQTVLISVQGKCTICAEYTTGMEILLGAPDGSPR